MKHPDVAYSGSRWSESIEFSNILSEALGLEACYVIEPETNKVTWPKGFECDGWRLPTEAEWEYAASGGEKHLYSGSNDPSKVARLVGTYLDKSLHEVMKTVRWAEMLTYDSPTVFRPTSACAKKKNAFGL